MFTTIKKLRQINLIACLVCGTVLAASYQIAGAGEKSAAEPIATITLKQEPDSITPAHLKVKLGTTIVWVNNDEGPVTIRFLDKLGIACKAPVNFYADFWGNYETGAIAQAATASICFIYKGTYKYEVKRLISQGDKASEQITTGTITAEE